jgi:hypothetical protein
MPEELDRLNALSYGELFAWLLGALQGNQPVPRLSPDEPSYVGILRLEADLDKPTRRDLARACAELVHGFARTGAGDVESVRSLLRLTAELGLDSVAGPLACMAEKFPGLPEVSGTIKGLVLATLVDLKEPQPVEFWRAILNQDRQAFAGTAIAGLLARNPSMAIDLVPTLPDDQNIADAIAIVLEQVTDQLAAAQRGEVYAHVRRVLSRCSPMMRGSIQEWLEERGELVSVRRSRDYSQLDTGLRMRNPQFTPQPASSRLSSAQI